MTWTNPLDRVPQIPQDWANHIIYGGALGYAVQLIGFPIWFACAVVFGIAALKKTVDYVKEAETVQVCLSKTFVTAVWPATIWAMSELANHGILVVRFFQ